MRMTRSIAALLALCAVCPMAVAQALRPGGESRLSLDLMRRAPEDGDRIDVIVRYKDQTNALVRHSRAKLIEVGMASVRVTPAELRHLEQDPDVEYLAPDRPVAATHFPPWMYMEAIGYRFAAMTVPERPIETGAGVFVAVLDSGVNEDAYFKTSPACTATRVVYHRNFVTTESTTADLYGHGTHVAGIVGGDGVCLGSAITSPLNAVAPKVNIVNLRVLDKDGRGKDSYVIAAIDHAIALKKAGTIPVRVINLSLGRPVRESFRLDPLCQAVEKAWKAGIVVVVAAGNGGRDNSLNTQGYGTIGSPANDPYVITVGATRMVGHTGYEDDTVASYSSKGPSAIDQVMKPDLVAPGNIVYARLDPSQYLVKSYQANSIGIGWSGVNVQNVFLLSGTSMAAPMVAGGVALMLQKDSSLKPDQIKARLMKTAYKAMVPGASIVDTAAGVTYNVTHDAFTVGAGHYNLKAALANTDKPSSKLLALSPWVKWTNGKAQVVKTYPSLPTSILWGESVLWGESLVWGDLVMKSGSLVAPSSVLWGESTQSGFSLLWGDSVLWGDTLNLFDEALSIQGDR